jgi:hypothetical protein
MPENVRPKKISRDIRFIEEYNRIYWDLIGSRMFTPKGSNIFKDVS